MSDHPTSVRIIAQPFADGTIELTTTWPAVGNLREQVHKDILRTQDEMIRQALIELGWTPPKDKTP